MAKLPLRYRILNRLIGWTGRRFAEDHFGHWSVKEGGGLQCRPVPLGTYSLRPRDESHLPDNATNIDRVFAKIGRGCK